MTESMRKDGGNRAFKGRVAEEVGGCEGLHGCRNLSLQATKNWKYAETNSP